MSSLVAACASNPPPPAASSETVVTATDTPSSSTTAVDTDMTRAADADRRAEMAAPGPTANSSYTDTNTNDAARARPADTTTTANTTAAQNPPAGTPPDNSKVNTRDRGDTLTPTDQGSSDADIKVTQQIRQAVMKDDSLSFTAKNVKIITVGGKVTLRGPVNTAQERTSIEAAAKKIAGVAQVENLLEIKK